jgi:hypothetical protein
VSSDYFPDGYVEDRTPYRCGVCHKILWSRDRDNQCWGDGHAGHPWVYMDPISAAEAGPAPGIKRT